jgi:hypothetical protein
MVAMLITLVSVFALLTSLDTATEVNVRNMQREEAVQIAGNRMTSLRVHPFDNISANYATEYVQPKLRGATAPFRVIKRSTNLSSSSKLVNVRVRWVYKNMSTSYELQSVIQQ